MDLESRYSEIKTFLSIPDNQFQLQQKINTFFESNENKIEILSKITNFIYYFTMFKNIKPFMHSLYKCILNTLDISIESPNDFNELLIKNSIMNFVQDYIDYAQLNQKRQVLKLLSDSLDRLQLQPLIINLGLLLKPMYQDQEYQNKLKYLEEIEVSYDFNDQIPLQIKKSMDNWLKDRVIDLNNQESIKSALIKEFEHLTNKYNILSNSETYEKLFSEVMEMFSIKLTLISLMESFPEDSLQPLSIK